MLLWLLFAVLTAVVLAVVLAPLGRPARAVATPDGVADPGTLAVYRHQLDEIDAERARGLVDEAEAAAAKTEVSRRLLASAVVADDGAGVPHPSLPAQRLTLAMAIVLLVPMLTLALYLT